MVIGFKTSSDSWEFDGIYHQLDRDTMTLWYLMIFWDIGSVWTWKKWSEFHQKNGWKWNMVQISSNFYGDHGDQHVDFAVRHGPQLAPPEEEILADLQGLLADLGPEAFFETDPMVFGDGNWREVLGWFLDGNSWFLDGQWVNSTCFTSWSISTSRKPWMKGMKLHTGTITVTMGVCIPSEGDGIIQ